MFFPSPCILSSVHPLPNVFLLLRKNTEHILIKICGRKSILRHDYIFGEIGTGTREQFTKMPQYRTNFTAQMMVAMFADTIFRLI